MGSSPVTATISLDLEALLEVTRTFLRTHSALDSKRPVVVAFSGGPDSTALLLAATSWAREGAVPVVAAHLDHAQDPDSGARAEAARELADRLGARFELERVEVNLERCSGETWETAARRIRYRFLEDVRRRAGADWILTGHHRDDQAETVLLRLLLGTGPAGLAGIQPVRWPVLRPLLSLTKAQLLEAVRSVGLVPVADPSNQSLDPLRNRLRAVLLPHLSATDPCLAHRLSRLAARARTAAAAVESRLEALLSPSCDGGGVAVARRDFLALPESLRGPALALLNKLAGAQYPPSRSARAELIRQLEENPQARCDCGGGWYWESLRGRLQLRQKRPGCARFSYTLPVPGEVTIPEIETRLRVHPGPAASRPRQPGTDCFELSLPFSDTGWVEIRNRLPGDRLQPVGSRRPRRLKEELIELGVPRDLRDRLPILCAAGNIAWVASVGIDERYRPRPGASLWTVEIGRDGEP